MSALKVLISRVENNHSALYLGAEVNGFQLSGISFIELKKKKFSIPPVQPHWVLFTSKNAIDAFFDHKMAREKVANASFAVAGVGTGEHLASFGIAPDFCPDYSDTDRMLKEWQAMLNPSDVVWFPCAKQTVGKVEASFSGRKGFYSIPVYQTSLKPKLLGFDFDVYIFTSPSNVRGFLQLNSLPKHATVFAMGKSTWNELQKMGGVRATLLPGYTPTEMLDAVLSLMQ